ncbi:MAG: tRNA uridine-5-carboxymethylaminomethyl(34) synthesis GTPase MnmE [Alphaproteobacteria bacterium]|nr:tRNA uridine-5-carboxymethylaminomethyl(34) synthesis GTPase MnmE [Alphaproteobacteria bacterium]
MRQTIYALSSGAGPAGVAVIRLSGPDAGPALLGVTGRATLPAPRRAIFAALNRPESGERIDDGLVLWFPAPHSYTGEDVVELHVHGGTAVVSAALESLGGMAGLRMAEPGEFTRRAFLNGRMDLTAAEGVADLVAAETDAQRRQALRQAEGDLARLYDGWRGRLVRTLAHFEAYIDFPDEEIPETVLSEINHEISALVDTVFQHIDDNRRGERLRAGLDIAIVGPPNAGKSSLMNRLARRDAAIVSETAGTTRDVIEVAMDLGGYPVILADTAGLREAEGSIEEEGVRRARRRAETADLRILVLDGGDPASVTGAVGLTGPSTLVALNKCDLAPPAIRIETPGLGVCAISATTGEGIGAFLDRLEAAVRERIGLTGQPVITRARHREALEHCLAALRRAQRAALPELAAEDLRLAARALGRITGQVDVEDLLDVIFRDFCIGK